MFFYIFVFLFFDHFCLFSSYGRGANRNPKLVSSFGREGGGNYLPKLQTGVGGRMANNPSKESHSFPTTHVTTPTTTCKSAGCASTPSENTKELSTDVDARRHIQTHIKQRANKHIFACEFRFTCGSIQRAVHTQTLRLGGKSCVRKAR